MLLEYRDTDQMFYQSGTDTKNKVIELYLIVSQVYNDKIHNSLKSNHRKIFLTKLLVFLVR
jgi:hypothetical protein